MEKRFSTLVGITLIFLGSLALLFNLIMPMLGFDVWRWGAWRLWPLIVVGIGWLFVLLPFLVHGWRGLGGLFIPGIPILVTGSILFLASFFNWWSVWEWLWPLEVLSVGLGFLFAAVYMRVTWLVVPAIIIGLNGLVLQFCALTGLWELWSVLWTVEPLAIGLSLLVVSTKNRSTGLFVAGLIMCSLAGLGFVGMTGLLATTVVWPWLWVIELAGPIVFILVGALLIGWNVMRRPSTSGLY